MIKEIQSFGINPFMEQPNEFDFIKQYTVDRASKFFASFYQKLFLRF